MCGTRGGRSPIDEKGVAFAEFSLALRMIRYNGAQLSHGAQAVCVSMYHDIGGKIDRPAVPFLLSHTVLKTYMSHRIGGDMGALSAASNVFTAYFRAVVPECPM